MHKIVFRQFIGAVVLWMC